MPKQNELITIEAHAYDIEIEENESPDGDIRSEMRMWCFNRKSEPCLLRVRDFPVFCKVELPRLKDSDGDPITWDEQRCAEIIDDINRKLDNKELPPVRDWEYKKMKKLYYYTPDKRKFPFLIVSFNTVNHMYATSKACKKLYTRRYGPLTLPFYEMKIPIYNKMFSLQKMSMTDKFTCKAREIDPDDPERISKEGPPPSEYSGGRPFKEYEIKWTTMKPSKDVWFSYPVICSFDIESYSHNHRTFPQKHDDEDVIFSISVTISKYMDIGNRKDYIIIIGDTLPAEKVDCPSAREGKLIIINVENEEQVLQRFFEIVEYEDPDVFIGYNIYGFDFDYMDARILDSGDEWPNLSRLSDDYGGKFEIKNLTWSSSGRGANKMLIPTGSGRISFDMYKYIQMDFKFSTYTLDAMAQEFLKENKDDLKYHEMFEIYGRVKETMKKGEPFSPELLEENTSVVKYNVQDSLLVTKLFEKLSVWVSVVELSSIVRVLPMQFCTRGQLMRCMAQIYHAASWKDIVLSTIDIEYNFFTGGYVANPLVGYWPLEMCFDFNSLYPSIIIAYNLCYTTWIRDIEKHIKKYGEDTIHIFDFEQEEPLGWKPPKNDKFDYSGYVKDSDAEDEEDPEGEDPDGGKKKGRAKKKEVKKVKKHYRLAFCKKEFKKGFIPEIEEGLLGNRKKVKKELKGEKAIVKNLNKHLFSALRQNEELCLEDIKDEDTLKFLTEVGLTKNSRESQKLKDWMDKIQRRFDAYNMMMVGFLDARQKGLKICANSLYGFFGATTNELYFVQMSNVITYMGRTLIIEAGHFFERNYNATVVYGDSILPDEPVCFLDPDNNFVIEEVGSIKGDEDWDEYQGFKVGESNRREKQQAPGGGYKVWSKGEWHKVIRFIRHKTKKKIYRIFTDKGVVDVTEDHSLLDTEWKKIKPGDCVVGETKLAHSYPSLGNDLRMGYEENPSDVFMASSDIFSKKELAEEVFIARKRGYSYVITGNDQRINITFMKGEYQTIDPYTIKKIEVLHEEYTDYVYDIETENGHFQAGIGEINVKNTDSTMVNIPKMDEELLKVKKYIDNSDMDTDYAKEIFKRLENGESVEDPEMVWLLAEVMDRHINGKLHIYDEKGNVIIKGPPSIFLTPLYLEAEKMMKSIHFKKKHYVYFEYDKKGFIICVDGTNEPQLECKGILLARRDNCKWSRFIYKDIVLSVFDGATPADIFKKIVDVILEVVDAKYETIVDKFSVVKGMGSNYKSKTTSMFVFGEEMKALKRPIQPGERVRYVVVKDHKGRQKVAERMRTIDLFHECWEASGLEYGDPVPEDYQPEEGMYPPEELDSVYYVEKVLMNPIDRLFGCVFNRVIEPFTKVGYRPHKNRRLGKAYANTPVKMIVQAIKDNKKVIEKKGFRSMAEPIKSFVGWYQKIEPGHDYGRMDDLDEEEQDFSHLANDA